MTKQEYIEKVKQALQEIPEKERMEALEYLEEYFLDAQESEEEVIANLGSPEKFAAMIKADIVVNTPPAVPKELKVKKESSIKKGWTILLGILALPLAIPVLIFIFVIVVVLVSLIFSLIVTLFALIVASLAGIFSLFTADIAFSVASIGPILTMIGIVILGICFIYMIVVYAFPWITKQLGNLYQKLKNKEN